jgi:hypothetical protein
MEVFFTVVTQIQIIRKQRNLIQRVVINQLKQNHSYTIYTVDNKEGLKRITDMLNCLYSIKL